MRFAKLLAGTPAKGLRSALLAALVASGLAACAAPPSSEFAPSPKASPIDTVEREKLPRFTQEGLASWYGKPISSKATKVAKLKRTANGERMGENPLTAAHRSLPMGTLVRVTNLANGLTVQVRVNDRGPYLPGRIIDLSHDAASEIGMKASGVVPVRIEVFDADQRRAANQTASR